MWMIAIVRVLFRCCVLSFLINGFPMLLLFLCIPRLYKGNRWKKRGKESSKIVNSITYRLNASDVS